MAGRVLMNYNDPSRGYGQMRLFAPSGQLFTSMPEVAAPSVAAPSVAAASSTPGFSLGDLARFLGQRQVSDPAQLGMYAGGFAPPLPAATNYQYPSLAPATGLYSPGGGLLAMMPAAGLAAAGAAGAGGYPYQTYVPTTGLRSYAPGAGGGFDPGQWYQAALDYAQGVQQRVLDQAGRAVQNPTAPGGGQGSQAAVSSTTARAASRAPAGINQAWWDEFTSQHRGQDPMEFYQDAEGVTATEGLRRALADREWGGRFAVQEGRAPTDADWEAHYWETRYGGRPSMLTPEERRQRRMARKGGANRKLPRFSQEQGDEGRAPQFIPPSVVWGL